MSASAGTSAAALVRMSGVRTARSSSAARPSSAYRLCAFSTSSKSSNVSPNSPKNTTSAAEEASLRTSSVNTTASGPDESKVQSSLPKGKGKISAALLLARSPVILRQPSPLESAYFQYNQKLSAALEQPFVKDFYFKKGSAAEQKFEADQAERRQILSGQKTSSRADLENDTAPVQVGGTEAEAELYTTQPRRTKADVEGVRATLDRRLERTLYLVLKEGSSWRLPSKLLDDGESLHAAAPKPVHAALGKNLDIWLASHLPVAVLPSDTPATIDDNATYVLRAQLIAGAASPKTNTSGYAWLTREEIQNALSPSQGGNKDDVSHWQGIQDLLNE
ncbi:Mitochondrial ribosomal protein L17 [Ceraceosorus bombacis]|uniref:Mitochondrial ribosomal protein L17 n=1 Tax=Ceraceosorus bombacis TaxID=401625 RepID=A0A0P1BE75_9BASI|nr:Mitochondrial ribosomal protein L17 [Ceraceosorus bombacis]